MTLLERLRNMFKTKNRRLLEEIRERITRIEWLLICGRSEVMAKWDDMVAAVEKIRGAEASAQEAFRQLQTKFDALSADMNDAEDQRKVQEFSAELHAIADRLPKAVAANPAPADTASTGGAR